MRRRVEGGAFPSLFLGFFFLVRFILICAFAYSSSAFLFASASLCILLHHHCFLVVRHRSSSSLEFKLKFRQAYHPRLSLPSFLFRRLVCSVNCFVTITCFATITYYFSLHTIMSHGIMTHYYTVELSMDICCVSGKSICTRSLNFFIVNPFRDFGDEPFPTKSRAT